MSLRLNLMVVCETVLLLIASLAVLFWFSRQALKEEAKQDAEQTLEGTMQHIDNILMSVEQSTYNIYQDLLGHLDQPDRMFTYSREIVECNPYIVGCAIVFKPGHYHGRDLFMAYFRRKGSSVSAGEHLETEMRDKFTNRPYTEQIWYTEPMGKCRACWVGPLKNEDTEDEALITFCLPIYSDGECVGVVATDVGTDLLSQIILDAKPSPHSYTVLLNRKGSYIIHPDREKQQKLTVFNLQEYAENSSIQEAAQAMMAGETGHKPVSLNNQDWYVFYKPFHRANIQGVPVEKQGWSVGMVFLEDDILGSHNILIWLVLAITILGLLLFFVLCRILIRKQMRPLRQLTRSAQRIAEGHYDETIPDPQRDDEIGQLEKHFQTMQKSLAAKSKELERLTARLKRRSEDLRKAYGQAQGSDRMKTSFLHYMTTQMVAPSDIIERSVMKLSNNFHDLSPQEADYEAGVIKEQSETVLDLLNHMIEALQIELKEEEDRKKGGRHD